MRLRTIYLVLALLPSLAGACINDRDTLAFELRNVDALRRVELETDGRKRLEAIQEIALKAISGRFERFPAKYYTLRIARLEAKARLSLSEVDDLAVAYERLGKTDRAIQILSTSRAARKTPDDRYRFYANLGTFHVHKWLVSKDRATNKALLKQSIAEIEKAVDINPKSHFGREKVQLALERLWLKSDPEVDTTSYEKSVGSDEDSIVGLAGIAIMGLGYELPDIYWLISKSYLSRQAGETELPGFASARFRDLVGMRHFPVLAVTDYGLPASNDAKFAELRENGERVHQSRLAYMETRFARGEHPDTHPSFWSEWKEPPVPVLKRIDPPDNRIQIALFIFGAVLLAVIVVATSIVLFIRWRMRVKARTIM